MRPDPIMMRCEGSLQAGHRVGWDRMCKMCGELLDPVMDPDGCIVVPEHQRQDILAMITRGDFG